MAESSASDPYLATNVLHPVEQGVVKKFDALFAAREKTLSHWVARGITNHQEFLGRTMPSLITTGAEHPQLSGGVLYIMGLVTKHVPQGSEAVNSIARRFAERRNTKKDTRLRPILHEIHTATEQAFKHPEQKPLEKLKAVSVPKLSDKERTIVSAEMKRAALTRELYDMHLTTVDVSIDRNGSKLDLGKNGSLVSVLNKNSTTGKSMVFFCSSSGEPPGAESFVVEYAMRTGNKVFVVGQPDAASGRMSQEFADEAKRDASPPMFDLTKQFTPPTYDAHGAFFKQMIRTLLPPDARFDLYSHSGGGIFAKKVLEQQDIGSRIDHAVFLNPAGTANFVSRFPFIFRTLSKLRILMDIVRDFPNNFRAGLEKDIEEDQKSPRYRFRSAVGMAIQNGSHYRQPGWDTLRNPTGTLTYYVGGRDSATNGKQFARFMRPALTAHPDPAVRFVYDKHGHHGMPFTHPESVLDKVLG
jgi:hypothetical protein